MLKTALGVAGGILLAALAVFVLAIIIVIGPSFFRLMATIFADPGFQGFFLIVAAAVVYYFVVRRKKVGRS